jgi:hypothetical protein
LGDFLGLTFGLILQQNEKAACFLKSWYNKLKFIRAVEKEESSLELNAE